MAGVGRLPPPISTRNGAHWVWPTVVHWWETVTVPAAENKVVLVPLRASAGCEEEDGDPRLSELCHDRAGEGPSRAAFSSRRWPTCCLWPSTPVWEGLLGS